MVGTIGRGGGMVGLVVAPDKVVYRFQPGVYMGQNDGRVTAVHEDRIELVELEPDGAGGWTERPASVALEDNCRGKKDDHRTRATPDQEPNGQPVENQQRRTSPWSGLGLRSTDSHDTRHSPIKTAGHPIRRTPLPQ